jgi:membrane protease YdiL (CAAX protease family)
MIIRTIFLNDVGRLRSGWRLVLFGLLFYVSIIVLGAIVWGVYSLVINFVPQLRPRTYLQDLVFRVVTLVAALGAGYLCSRWLEGLPWRSLGASPHRGWFKHLLFGSLIGLASLALATAIATIAGGLSFTISGTDTALLVGRTLFGSAVIFIVAAFAEEALFRGYPVQTLTRAHLASLAIGINFLFFAAAHFNNPNWVPLGAFNTGLAGIWLTVAYLRTRSLWFPLGVHWAWNWSLGSLFGLPVSGLTFSPHPLMRGTDLGPAWLTGGSYGIEGGAACTVALLVSTIFIWRTRLLKPNEELLKLTSEENPVRTERLSILGDEATPLGDEAMHP